jgi:hypothetical protein
LAKLLSILRGVFVIREDGDSSRLEYAQDLPQSPAASLAIIDVVQTQIRNNNFECPVGESHFLCGNSEEHAAIANALELQVVAGGRFRIAAHVHV